MSILPRRSGVDPFGFVVRSLAPLGMTILLASCGIIPRHQFAEPSQDWRARNGQLLYRTAKTTIIGEVVVRFSSADNFELTFSKGPGVTLLIIRQDPNFVRISGPLARGSWSGPPAQVPARFRGWVQLREKLIHALAAGRVRPTGGQDRQSLRHVAGAETFVFRF